VKLLIFTDYDLDGAGSALFIKWLYKDKLTDLTVVETTEGTLVNEFRNYEHTLDHFDKVFILDLDLNQEQIAYVDRSNVVVVDHHTPHARNKHLYKKAKAVIQEFSSCINLLYSKFGSAVNLTDPQEELVKYIDDYDSYILKHKDSLKLNAIYRTYNNPKTLKFIEAFGDGFRPYSVLEKNGIKLFINKFKEQLNNQVFTGTIKNYKTVSIFANYAISEVAHYIISKNNADIGIVINLDTKTVSFRRSKTSEVDVSVLAETLCGGGGSPAAAGGSLTDQFANLTKNFK